MQTQPFHYQKAKKLQKRIQLGSIYGCNAVQSAKENQPKVYQKLVEMSNYKNQSQLTALETSSPVNVIKVKNFFEGSNSSRSRSAQKMYSERERVSSISTKNELRQLIYFPQVINIEQKDEENQRKQSKNYQDNQRQLSNSSYIFKHQRRISNSPLTTEPAKDIQSHVALHNLFNKRQKQEEGIINAQRSFCETPKIQKTVNKELNEQINIIKTNFILNEKAEKFSLVKKKLLGPPTLYSRVKKNPQQFRNIENLIKNRPNDSHEQNMQEYLKRIGCADKSKKVYCFNSSDVFVKEVLSDLGWIENKIINSDLFHLKWIYTDSPKDYENLKDGQYFNHFQNNQELTNKGRLLRNLRIHHQKYPKLLKYFPLQFDLSNKPQKEYFLKEFKKFEELKNFKQLLQTINNNIDNSFLNQLNTIYNQFKKQEQIHIDCQNNDCLIVLRALIEFNSIQQIVNKVMLLLKDIDDKNLIDVEIIEKFVSNETTELPFNKDNQHITEQRDNQLIQFIIYLSILINLETLLQPLFPYSDFSNYWIVKPCGNSKGQGLQIMSDELQIINYTNQLQARLVQKYIERVYICKNDSYPQLYNKKFDLRLWVLVKSFKPLVVYYYKQGYLRICSSDYDLSDPRNTFSHFTNYSINKNRFISNKNIEDSAISLKIFKNLIKNEHGVCYDSQIQPKINQIITHSLKSVQSKIKQNSCCFEIYGFDIIFDEDLNPYLLEVNLSPACQKRSEFISKLQKNMFSSSINLLFNNEHQSVQNWKKIEISEHIQINKYKIKSKKQIQNLNLQQIPSFCYPRQENLKDISAAIIIQRWFKSFKAKINQYPHI